MENRKKKAYIEAGCTRVVLVMLLHGIVMYVRKSHNDVMGH